MSKLIHLLIPKEFRVWCVPSRRVGELDVTIYPSKSTCANCLTKWRSKTKGIKKFFRVRNTIGRKFDPLYEQYPHKPDTTESTNT